jgi:tRNA A-37 threonylcarbamoyl transferase component Bud32
MAEFARKKKPLLSINTEENNPEPDSLYENENKLKEYDFGDIKVLIANYIKKNISTTNKNIFIKDFEKVSQEIIQKLNGTDKKKKTFNANAKNKNIALDSYLDGIYVKSTIIQTYVSNYYIKTAVCMNVYALLVVIIEMIYTQLAYDFFQNSNNMSVPEPLFYFEKDKYYYYAYIKTVEVDDSFTLFKSLENGDSIQNIEKCYQTIHVNLSKLNNYGIYHNDVNPGNLFFKQDDKGNYSFKLIDFGNASTKPNVTAGNTLEKLEELENDNQSKGALIPKDFNNWIKGYINNTGENKSRSHSTYGGSNHRTRKRKQKKKASRKKRSKKNRRSQKKNRKHRRQ